MAMADMTVRVSIEHLRWEVVECSEVKKGDLFHWKLKADDPRGHVPLEVCVDNQLTNADNPDALVCRLLVGAEADNPDVLNWTQTAPTENGLYWWKLLPDSIANVVEVIIGKGVRSGGPSVPLADWDTIAGWWWPEPLVQPGINPVTPRRGYVPTSNIDLPPDCPFCGGCAVLRSELYDLFRVECTSCGIRTADRDSKKWVMGAWAKRKGCG